MLFGLMGSLYSKTSFQEPWFDFIVFDGFMKQVMQEGPSSHTNHASPSAHTSYLLPPSLTRLCLFNLILRAGWSAEIYKILPFSWLLSGENAGIINF